MTQTGSNGPVRQQAAEHRLWVLIDIDPPAAELTDAELAAAEWAMKADRKLDELDDEQLIYLHSAIEVTLDERGYRFDERKAGTRRWGRPGA